MRRVTRFLVPVLALVVLLPALTTAADDPLPSWREGAAKQQILDFVATVTQSGGKGFVPPAARIATFDNDGTLWVEKPLYTQILFVFERVQALASDHPEWKSEPPFQWVIENDKEKLSQLELADILRLIGSTNAGMTEDEYSQQARTFFATARHPRWKRPYTDLVYQPQLELMSYLRANGFRVFIVTGGGRDFVRVFSERIYRVPRSQVTGSALQARYEWKESHGRLVRVDQNVIPMNDGPGKPVTLYRDIGRRPILTFGNSDGDIQMMEYAIVPDRPWLSLLLHHDDAEREYDYDRGTEKALALAAERGFSVVSMKKDFEVVFPFDPR
jgi:hypothetical protein